MFSKTHLKHRYTTFESFISNVFKRSLDSYAHQACIFVMAKLNF